MVVPFASNSLWANERAWTSKQAVPTREECKALSLVLPADDFMWDEVHITFTVARLENSAASTQFKEDLPLILARLLMTECNVCHCLALSFSTQMTLEILVSANLTDKRFTLLAKHHLQSMDEALHSFGVARSACREHVFMHAKVKHVPRRLINSLV